MADPVTNVEMEDVLSSIRRLVSEDGRTGMKSQPIVNEQKFPEKLVLTPALRVSPDEAEQAAEPEVNHTENILPTEDEHAQDAESSIQVEAENDTQDDSQHDLDEEFQVDDAAAEVNDAAQHDEDVNDQEIPDVVENLMQDQEQAEPVDTAVSSLRSPDTQADETEGLSDDMGDAPESAEFASDVVRLEDRIVGLETAVAGRTDQWEPDGLSDDDYAGGQTDALPWEDVSEAPEVGGAEQSISGDFADDEIYAEVDMMADDDDLADIEDAETDLFGGNETVLDEDTLREMVSEIVRQELQGTLGERITRNVRKLVRREIHRALASQELE